MSRCQRCNGCRNQWAEGEGEPCPHCNYPRPDTRTARVRVDDAFEQACDAVDAEGIFTAHQVDALKQMLGHLKDAFSIPE